MMHYILLALTLSCSSFFQSDAMDPHMDPPIKRQYPLDFQPMRFVDDPVDDHSINPHPITVTNLTAPTFEGVPVQDLETALTFAPEKFNDLLSYLTTDHKLYGMFYKAKIIFGNHGAGKTTLVKALVYRACTKAGGRMNISAAGLSWANIVIRQESVCVHI